jgi:hypothetical protein
MFVENTVLGVKHAKFLCYVKYSLAVCCAHRGDISREMVADLGGKR